MVKSDQTAKTLTKLLVNRWFCTCGVLLRIHSDKGMSFDNSIVVQLCKLYGIKNSQPCHITLYENSPCEKPDWPSHFDTLVCVYNVMPLSTTGYQQHQLMFGCKAPTPSDDWLVLTQYDSRNSVSGSFWIKEQAELINASNRHGV